MSSFLDGVFPAEKVFEQMHEILVFDPVPAFHTAISVQERHHGPILFLIIAELKLIAAGIFQGNASKR